MTKKFYIFFKDKNFEKNFYLTLTPLVLIINSVIWIKNEGTVLAMIFLGSIFLLKNIRFHIKIFLLSSFMFSILTPVSQTFVYPGGTNSYMLEFEKHLNNTYTAEQNIKVRQRVRDRIPYMFPITNR